MRRVIARGLVAAAVALLPAPVVAQAELKVLVGGAMSEPVAEIGQAFERSSGRKVVWVRDTTGALQKRLASGCRRSTSEPSSPRRRMPDAARAFLHRMAAPEGQEAVRKAGLEPVGAAR